MASVAEGKRKGFLSFFAQSRFDYSDSYATEDNREGSNFLTALKECRKDTLMIFWPLYFPDDQPACYSLSF